MRKSRGSQAGWEDDLGQQITLDRGELLHKLKGSFDNANEITECNSYRGNECFLPFCKRC